MKITRLDLYDFQVVLTVEEFNAVKLYAEIKELSVEQTLEVMLELVFEVLFDI